MRYSILSVVLFGLVVVASSFKFNEVRSNLRGNLRAVTSFLTHHDASSKGIHRRQISPQCLEAYEEFQSTRFQQCYAVLEKVEDMDVTTNDLVTYCANDCTSEVIDVATKLAEYCDSGVSVFCVVWYILLCMTMPVSNQALVTAVNYDRLCNFLYSC